jgi:hypothetical protein
MQTEEIDSAIKATWEDHAEAGGRMDRIGEAAKWEACEEYAKAHEAGASYRQIGGVAGFSHTHVRRMVKALETKVSTPDVSFVDAYRPVPSPFAGMNDLDFHDGMLFSLYGWVAEKADFDGKDRALGMMAWYFANDWKRATRATLDLMPMSLIMDIGKVYVALAESSSEFESWDLVWLAILCDYRGLPPLWLTRGVDSTQAA